MRTLSPIFEELIGGRVGRALSLADDALSAFDKAIPSPLVDLYRAVGLCSIRGGRLQLCDPTTFRGILALVFGQDEQFGHESCHAFAFSPFGTLYCWSDEFALVIVDLIGGKVTSRGALGKIKPGSKVENLIYLPFSLSDDALDLDDDDGRPLFLRAVERLGEPDLGECLGFFPALAFGGPRRLDHLRRVRAPEHFAIIAQASEFRLVDVQGYGETKVVRAIG